MRLFMFTGLTALLLAVAANAQPPASPPVVVISGSDKAIPVVVVSLATKEEPGKKLTKLVLNELKPGSGEYVKVEDPFYTYNLKKTKLAKKVAVLPGTALMNPVFPVGQKAPKGFPALADRKLLVLTTSPGLVLLEEDIDLEAEVTFDGVVIKSNSPTITIYVEPDPIRQYTLPTDAVVPSGTKLKEDDVLQELEKARELAKRPTIINTKETISDPDLNERLAKAPAFKSLKEGHDKLQKSHDELTEKVAKLKDDLEAKITAAETRIGVLLAGKASKESVDDINRELFKLGNLKELKDNADKVPGLVTDVANLKKTPVAVPVPTPVQTKMTMPLCLAYVPSIGSEARDTDGRVYVYRGGRNTAGAYLFEEK